MAARSFAGRNREPMVSARAGRRGPFAVAVMRRDASTVRAASRPLTTAPSIHPAPNDAMSPPANTSRPSGAIWPPASPLSQPGGGANHVPFEKGSATQSCPSLVTTSLSGR